MKKLNLWEHPGSGKPRLYVSAAFYHQVPGASPKNLKIWFEKSGKGWNFQAKADKSLKGVDSDLLKSQVMAFLGVNESFLWEDLMGLTVTQAEAPKPIVPARGIPSLQEDNASSLTSHRAIEASMLDVASIKMPGPIEIDIDHREPEELIRIIESHPMVTVNRVSLPLGDIEIRDREGNKAIIERKRCDSSHAKTDLEASVQVDGRWFDQSERLKLEAQVDDKVILPVFLLEGDAYGNSKSMLCQQVDGALSFLVSIQRMSILPTLNINHTAYMIVKLATHFVDGLYSPVSLHKAKPKALFAQKSYILESMPGVSSKIAELLLAHFGSIKAVINADENALKAIPGLGPKKIQQILAAIS